MATTLATNNGAIKSLEWQLFFSNFHDRLTDLGLPYKKTPLTIIAFISH